MVVHEEGRDLPMMRSHRAGDLRKTDVGTSVALCGWVANPRDHVVQHLLVIRPAHGGAQPRVAGHHKFGIEITVVEHARGRDFFRLGKLDDEVGLAEGPVGSGS